MYTEKCFQYHLHISIAHLFVSIFLMMTGTIASASCLSQEKPRTDLNRYFASFQGGHVSENMVAFYTYLWDNSLLPCSSVEITKENTSVNDIFVKVIRVLPEGYPSSMSILLCKMNPNRCIKNSLRPYYAGAKFTVPDIQFEKRDFVQEIKLEPSDKLPEDLELILQRSKIITDSITEEERKRILEAVSARNIGFERIFSRKVDKTRFRVIEVKRMAYDSRVLIPEDHPKTNIALKNLIEQGKVILLPDKSDARWESKNHLSTETVRTQIQQIHNVINLPSPIPGKRRTAKILIADRGFDKDNISGNTNATSNSTFPDNACDPANKNHGMHVGGIINGKFGGIVHGLSPEADTELWDFDEHKSNLIRDFLVYIQGDDILGKHIINLSGSFEGNITDSERNQIEKVLGLTKGLLYVIAGGNKKETFEDGNLPPLISAHRSKNVIVVAALDTSGELLWRSSAKNKSAQFRTVHLAAPGENIPSLCHGGSMGVMTGTSQATAFVSAAAALLIQEGITIDPWRIKLRLLYTADILPDLRDSVMSGRLNISRALDMVDDKLCLLNEISKDDSGKKCNTWLKGDIRIGILRNDNKFEDLQKVKIIDKDARSKVVRTDSIVRIFGRPQKNYTVFYLMPDGKLELLNDVSDIIPDGNMPPDRLRFWSDRWEGVKHLTLSQVGDFVRNVNVRMENE